jgi:hypothetical protein
MEKIMISIAKGRGETTLNKASSEKANKMPHHHLSTFIMGIPLPNRLLKNSLGL